MYQIDYTTKAIEELTWFKKYEQNEIIDEIEAQLRYEPTVETRNRKRMRPNTTAEWELRIGNFRVLYDVDEQARIVDIERIGLKRGNTLFFRGQQEDI